MLKGHVFKKQIFGNQMFALFINTFLDGANGISNDYKNKMAVTYNGSTLTVQSGAVCIQGRFLEEDTSTDISAGTDTMYCKLVIEIDLDKQNTETDFLQGVYKVIKSASVYPSLTQQNIVGSNSGVYQYELARFRTSANGITDFTDMRTYLDFDSIYSAIRTEYRAILAQLQQELASVEDGSAYVLNKVKNKKISLSKNEDNFYITWKKHGKVVTLDVILILGTGKTSTSGMLNLDDVIPDFAKTPEHVETTIELGSHVAVNSFSNSGQIIGTSGMAKCSLIKRNLSTYTSGEYLFMYAALFPEDGNEIPKIIFHINYIIDDTPEEGYVLGDVNGDSLIDEKDTELIKNYIMGYFTLSDKEFKSADVNNSNSVTASDYTKLKNYIDGVINSLE